MKAAIIHLVFPGKIACDRHEGDVFPLRLQLPTHADDGVFDAHRGQAPFVHHPVRAVSRAAAGAVEGDHVGLRGRGDAEHALDVPAVVPRHLEIDVARTQLPKFADAPCQGLLMLFGGTRL